MSGEDPPSTRAREDKDKSQSNKSSKKKRENKEKKDNKKSGKRKVDTSAVPADKKAEKKALKALGESEKSFKIKHSKHFSILYDTSEEDVEIFKSAVERTYQQCVRRTQHLGIDVTQPKKKLVIHYFNELEDYSGHSERMGHGKKDENAAGFFVLPVPGVPGSNMSYFYNFRNSATFKAHREQAEAELRQLSDQMRTAKTSADRKNLRERMKEARRAVNSANSLGGGISEEVVQHETAHQVLYNIGFHNRKSVAANPRWLAEGMAQKFEPVSTGTGSGAGLVNTSRLVAFRQLVEAGQLVPLREFISTSAFFYRPDAGALAYPQSWALLHYISRVKRDELTRYVELVNKRPKDYETTPEKEIETFEKAFGKIDEKWEKKWLNWMKNVR